MRKFWRTKEKASVGPRKKKNKREGRRRKREDPKFTDPFQPYRLYPAECTDGEPRLHEPLFFLRGASKFKEQRALLEPLALASPHASKEIYACIYVCNVIMVLYFYLIDEDIIYCMYTTLYRGRCKVQ
jgi:hypothetical protein